MQPVPRILALATAVPPYPLDQKAAVERARRLFAGADVEVWGRIGFVKVAPKSTSLEERLLEEIHAVEGGDGNKLPPSRPSDKDIGPADRDKGGEKDMKDEKADKHQGEAEELRASVETTSEVKAMFFKSLEEAQNSAAISQL